MRERERATASCRSEGDGGQAAASPKVEAPKQGRAQQGVSGGSLGVLGNGQPRHSPSQAVGRLSQALKAEGTPRNSNPTFCFGFPPIYAREMGAYH